MHRQTMALLSVDSDVRVAVGDGVHLATTVVRPQGQGRWPVILMRTPYDRTAYASQSLQVNALALAAEGYAVVLQDVRGRGSSEGGFTPFVNEQADGVDTVEWAVEQPWCNGSIGLAGISYNAFAQSAVVVTNHEAVRCWMPGLAPSDVRTSWIRRGGVVDIGFHLAWGLGAIAPLDDRTPEPEAVLAAYDDPVRTARRSPRTQPEMRSTPAGDWFFEWLDTADPYPGDPRVPTLDDLSGVRAPALVVAGWFDVFSSGSVELLEALRSGGGISGHRLVAGPWDHSGLPLARRAGDRDFGRVAALDLHRLQLRWFDAQLRDGDQLDADRIFVTGRGEWIDEPRWPPPTEDLEIGLGPDGMLRRSSSEERVVELVLSSSDPTPATGGAFFPWEPALRPGSFDQTSRRARADVVELTGPRLSAPVLVAGVPRLEVQIAPAETGHMVHATLVEVAAEAGPVWNIADGVALVEPKTGRASLSMGPVAHQFARGSAIGLDIACGVDVRFPPQEPGRRVIDLSPGASVLTLPVTS